MPSNPGTSDPTTPDGGKLLPIYAERKMKCFTVSESELKQIGLANLAITICFGIGSALIAFGVDIFKDTVLAAEVPDDAAIVVSYVQPICIFAGLMFWAGAVALFFWRRSMISLIKEESG